MQRIKSGLTALAVGIVLLAALDWAAAAATGKSLVFGKWNQAGQTTTLKNAGSGPALEMRAKGPAIAVRNTERIKNLDADQLDGIGRLSEQAYAEAGASVTQTRVVIYTVLEKSLFILGDSNTATSRDVEHDPYALLAANTGRTKRGTLDRGKREFSEVAYPDDELGLVFLTIAPTSDALSSLHVFGRRLVIAGLIGLLFAAVVGYAAAAMHARRIRRLERAAERIAGGHFDEPVIDGGHDELGELADAFERMRVRLRSSTARATSSSRMRPTSCGRRSSRSAAFSS